MMMRFILLNLAFVAATCNAAAQMSLGVRQRMLTPIVVGVRRATMNTSHQRYTNKPAVVEPSVTSVSRGGAAVCDGACKPPVKLLRWAYAAAGVATTAGWGTMVYTTIRDNQPAGAMMPCWQHPVFARIGAMSAAVSCVAYNVDCTCVRTVSFSNYYILLCAQHFHSLVSHTRIICKSRCYMQ